MPASTSAQANAFERAIGEQPVDGRLVNSKNTSSFSHRE